MFSFGMLEDDMTKESMLCSRVLRPGLYFMGVDMGCNDCLTRKEQMDAHVEAVQKPSPKYKTKTCI